MRLTPENELILLCAQIRIPTDKRKRVIALLSLNLQWEKILKFALTGGLAPLIYNSLKSFKESVQLPLNAMNQLKACYFQNIARNAYHCAEVGRIYEALISEGINVIILKGLALAGTVYADIGLRVFNDLDILVKKRDISAAEKIIRQLNYRADYPQHVLEHYKNNHHHLAPYYNPEKGTVVEIHSSISPYVNIDIDEWWKNAKKCKIFNFNALILRPENMLIHLCLHLFSGGNTGNTLRGIYDIAETLRFYSGKLNWPLIKNQIEKYNIRNEFYSIIFVIQQFYGLPDSSKCIVDFKRIDFSLVSIIQKSSFSYDKNITFPGSLIKAMAAESWPEKLKILKNKIFPDRNTMAIIYNIPENSKFIYVFYVERMIYLCRRYSKFFIMAFLQRIKNIIPYNLQANRRV